MKTLNIEFGLSFVKVEKTLWHFPLSRIYIIKWSLIAFPGLAPVKILLIPTWFGNAYII